MKSWVWKYFTHEADAVVCNICKKHMHHLKGAGTSTMAYHLRHLHKDKLNAPNSNTKENSGEQVVHEQESPPTKKFKPNLRI